MPPAGFSSVIVLKGTHLVGNQRGRRRIKERKPRQRTCLLISLWWETLKPTLMHTLTFMCFAQKDVVVCEETHWVRGSGPARVQGLRPPLTRSIWRQRFQYVTRPGVEQPQRHRRLIRNKKKTSDKTIIVNRGLNSQLWCVFFLNQSFIRTQNYSTVIRIQNWYDCGINLIKYFSLIYSGYLLQRFYTCEISASEKLAHESKRVWVRAVWHVATALQKTRVFRLRDGLKGPVLKQEWMWSSFFKLQNTPQTLRCLYYLGKRSEFVHKHSG